MKKRMLTATGVIVAGGIAMFIWTGMILDKGSEPQADGTNDYAILLGAKVKENGEPSLSLRYRLEAAREYLEQHPDVKIIVSGGQGAEEPMSEAEFMFSYLVEAGIAEDRIIREAKSTSTYENILYSKKLLPSEVSKVTIISSDFHLARAQYLARELELETDVVQAETPKSVRAKLQIRERAALVKAYILGR
ncbi:YdcF family protein [Lysinibacillus sp. 54212]|uniref:YdcF family protein n=1 Tax=Lysinibacillus sp. 54212 TaxID=3119829 RepID=UPI002FC7CDAC